MRRILFVDDEPNILDGLRRSLRNKRGEWRMEFACGGRAALEALDRSTFDVVVSDMRMPEMDGAELLARVMRAHPRTIRLILSGHADRAAVMRSVGVAHQFINKPCDTELLAKTIERTCSLRDLVGSESVAAALGGVDRLPTVPALYAELLECLRSDASTNAIAAVIAKDPGMTARVLQLANSAFFGPASPIASIEGAVKYLGLETLGGVVLAHGLFAQYEQHGVVGLDAAAIRDHGVAAGAIARAIAKAEGSSNEAADQALIAGILHDVGKLVLASAFRREFARCSARGGPASEILALELELFGVSHPSAGAYLLGLWGLPMPVVEAVAFHEMPSQCIDTAFGVFGMVHVATRLDAHPEIADAADPALDLDHEYLARAGVLGRWPVWRDALCA
jgi:HD-like signal output (HDOD) protein